MPTAPYACNSLQQSADARTNGSMQQQQEQSGTFMLVGCEPFVGKGVPLTSKLKFGLLLKAEATIMTPYIVPHPFLDFQLLLNMVRTQPASRA